MRYLVFVLEGHKTLDFRIENAKTIHIAFFRMTTHQLLPNAYAQNWLGQGGNDLVESTLPKVVHRIAGLALTWENDLVCTTKFLGRIGQERFHTHSLQSMNDGKDVPSIVFYYGNLHNTYMRAFALSACKGTTIIRHYKIRAKKSVSKNCSHPSEVFKLQVCRLQS